MGPANRIFSSAPCRFDSTPCNDHLMKKTFIAVLGFAIVAESWAQGLIYFSNSVWNRFSAPVFQPDGRTYAPAGSIYVQLHAGPDANSLAPVGLPVLLGPRDGFYDGGL